MGAIHIDFVSTLVEPTDERMSYRLVLVISGLEIFLGQTKYILGNNNSNNSRWREKGIWSIRG